MSREDKSWTWEEDGMTVVRTMARTGPGCHEGCGVLLYVKDGKLVKVMGDPDCPFNHGRLCPRCIVLPEVVYHPDRLKYPLKRVGKKGDDKWERISWDEALDSIAENFNGLKKEYGAESVIFCMGTGRDIIPYNRKLAYGFGSPNVLPFGPLHGHACHEPKIISMRVTTGAYEVADCSQFFADRYDNPNWKVPKCVIVWGNEPTISNSDGFMGHWLLECMKRGTELIVIDPKRTWIATRAKIWMQIRPGTDGALALGMLNVIINEGLYDEGFVRDWTHGFDELKERVQEYQPEKVSKITWIPEEQIIEAARFFAAGKPASIQWGVSVDQTKECIPALQAMIAMRAITGNTDVAGGNVVKSRAFGLSGAGIGFCGDVSEEQRKKIIGAGIYPLFEHSGYPFPAGAVLTEQMLTDEPYPIRGAWIQTTNTFACSAGDSKRIYDGFKRLDFVVVVDLFMTPTAMAFADIVLPAATYAERDGIGIPIGGEVYISMINKAIEPVGEVKSDMEINLELGKRLNPDEWPWENVREMFDTMLEPTGMSFEEARDKGYLYDDFEYKKYEKSLIRSDGKPGFETPTGKLELYSTILEKSGLDPLPYFEEPPESPVSTPELAKEYPLVLTTGAKTRAFFHSEHRQIKSLRKMNPDPIIDINPDAAAKYGIENDDWVYIENRYGRCKQKARVTDGIHPGVVAAQHGWWFPEKSAPEPSLYGAWESNINLLLPDGWTGKAGFGYPFKAQMCKIYKVEESYNG